MTAITPEQFQRLLAELGLTQSSAAEFLGVDERTMRRWIAGDYTARKSAVKLLRLMYIKGYSPQTVDALTE